MKKKYSLNRYAVVLRGLDKELVMSPHVSFITQKVRMLALEDNPHLSIDIHREGRRPARVSYALFKSLYVGGKHAASVKDPSTLSRLRQS